MANIDWGLHNPEEADNFTPLQFRYNFKSPFSDVACAFIKKYHYEGVNQLTSVSNIQQLDDDRVLFYRKRHEASMGDNYVLEQVVINR